MGAVSRRALVRVSEESEEERRAMAERHRAALQDVERRIEVERESFRQQAELASSTAQTRCRQLADATVAEATTRAESQIRSYQQQIEALGSDFRRYQASKQAEIAALEQQLMQAASAGAPLAAAGGKGKKATRAGPATAGRPVISIPTGLASSSSSLVLDDAPGSSSSSLDPAYTAAAREIRQAMEVEGRPAPPLTCTIPCDSTPL